VRYDERVKAGKATINGVSLADRKKAPRGRRGGGVPRQVTVEAINKAIANKGTLPAPHASFGQLIATAAGLSASLSFGDGHALSVSGRRAWR
jgi:hypothetical protein